MDPFRLSGLSTRKHGQTANSIEKPLIVRVADSLIPTEGHNVRYDAKTSADTEPVRTNCHSMLLHGELGCFEI